METYRRELINCWTKSQSYRDQGNPDKAEQYMSRAEQLTSLLLSLLQQLGGRSDSLLIDTYRKELEELRAKRKSK